MTQKELENRIQELNYTLEDTIALELTTKEVSSLLMKSFSENDFVNVEGIYNRTN
jgi:transcriptional regulator NrdR family protein